MNDEKVLLALTGTHATSVYEMLEHRAQAAEAALSLAKQDAERAREECREINALLNVYRGKNAELRRQLKDRPVNVTAPQGYQTWAQRMQGKRF